MSIYKHLPNCRVWSTVRQEEDEQAWRAARNRGIGGSDIGAICGVSPFSSARKVYFSKTGQYQDALEPGSDVKERWHWGHKLEPVVADEYAQRTGNKIVVSPATMVHTKYPWALANIDRFIVDDDGHPVGILECKTTSEYMNEEWESGEILLSYIYQLNWYLWITGLERGAFACLVGGNKFYHYDVYRDDELLETVLIPTAEKFWHENVLKMVEPELQGSDTELVKSLFSDVVKGSEITLIDDVSNDLLATIVDCKARIKELEKVKEEAENRIKDRMKEHEIGFTKDYVVKWSPRSQTRVDTDELKNVFPDVYKKCQKVITFRVMTVKGGI